MATHFAQLFWGLLLVILDFSINGFDLLADGVGYLIVAAGCSGLLSLSSGFATARTLCIVLAVLWLIGFAVQGDIAVAYELVTTVVNCAMIWQLLGGVGEFAQSRERQDLVEQADNCRAAYVAIMAGVTILSYFMQGSRNAGLMAVVLAIAMLVLIVLILHLIHRVKTELAT